MSKEKEVKADSKASSKPEAFSECGCLRGSLDAGIITVEKINDQCDHNIEPTDIPQSAARDVASILFALKK